MQSELIGHDRKTHLQTSYFACPINNKSLHAHAWRHYDVTQEAGCQINVAAEPQSTSNGWNYLT